MRIKDPVFCEKRAAETLLVYPPGALHKVYNEGGESDATAAVMAANKSRWDHKHYYALAITHYIDADSQYTFDSRRVVCIFCNEVHKRFPLKKRSELEVYTENTVYYRSVKNAG